MSGTIAHKRRMEAAKEAEFLKLREKSAKQKSLQLNREAVIAEICSMFGWKELDPFAKEMLDKAFAGHAVDIEQLKKDLAAWKSAQAAVPETEVKPETEEVENVDKSV